MKNVKGNTLVEVIVSFVIMSIVITALSTVFVQSQKISKSLKDKDALVTEIENIIATYQNDKTLYSTSQVLKYQNGEFVEHEIEGGIGNAYAPDPGSTEIVIIVDSNNITITPYLKGEIHQINNKDSIILWR